MSKKLHFDVKIALLAPSATPFCFIYPIVILFCVQMGGDKGGGMIICQIKLMRMFGLIPAQELYRTCAGFFPNLLMTTVRQGGNGTN